MSLNFYEKTALATYNIELLKGVDRNEVEELDRLDKLVNYKLVMVMNIGGKSPKDLATRRDALAKALFNFKKRTLAMCSNIDEE